MRTAMHGGHGQQRRGRILRRIEMTRAALARPGMPSHERKLARALRVLTRVGAPCARDGVQSLSLDRVGRNSTDRGFSKTNGIANLCSTVQRSLPDLEKPS